MVQYPQNPRFGPGTPPTPAGAAPLDVLATRAAAAVAQSIAADPTKIPVGGIFLTTDGADPSANLGYGTWTLLKTEAA